MIKKPRKALNCLVRVVPKKLQTHAVGMQITVMRIFGAMPAPVIMARILKRHKWLFLLLYNIIIPIFTEIMKNYFLPLSHDVGWPNRPLFLLDCENWQFFLFDSRGNRHLRQLYCNKKSNLRQINLRQRFLRQINLRQSFLR